MVEVRRNSAAVLAARKAVKSAAVTLRRQEVESGTATIAGVPIWIDATSPKVTGTPAPATLSGMTRALAGGASARSASCCASSS